MIGIYDYTVLLTYLSLVSASMGIVFTLSGEGSPYIGVFFLMLCGLFDGFDGKVASMKKNRSCEEKRFGIQIDSLSDLVAFGVLPMCIGVSVFRTSSFIQLFIMNFGSAILLKVLCYSILILYVLAALIRLAYFNVTEEDRQKEEKGIRKVYIGLPVTSAAILFPSVLLLQYITPFDLSFLYFIVSFCMAFLFLLKFRIKKLDTKGILFFVFIGVLEFLIFLFLKFFN